MHLILAAYLFIGVAYSAWSISRADKAKFDAFGDYLRHVASHTFAWPVLLGKDVIISTFDKLFDDGGAK